MTLCYTNVAEIATSNAPFEAAENSAIPAVGILITNADGLILKSNEIVSKLTGLSEDRLLGLNLYDLWPKTAGKLFPVRHRPAPGIKLSEIPGCFLNCAPLPGKSGGLAVAIVDFDRHRHHAAPLGPNDPLTSYYRQILETSPDGISVYDDCGRLILFNRASAEQTGLQADEIKGHQADFLVRQRLLDRSVCPDVLKNKKPITKLIRHFKTNRLVLATGKPIFKEDGEVQLVVVTQRDLTEVMELMADPEEQNWLLGQFDSVAEVVKNDDPAAFDIVAQSLQMKRTLTTALKLAYHGIKEVLLTGESGTGKGMIAKFIHANTKNSSEPFIHLNCAAMPESLLEAELFGYEKGAFTGAHPGGRPGLVETVGQGTIFLDEIGEMPLSVQAKFLTFLDNHEFRRVGGNKNLSSHCSIIAATNRNLEELVSQRQFREDLYFRLNVFCLRLPPLRDRAEDIMDMAKRKLAEFNRRYCKSMILDPLAVEILNNYDFPGNVRELVNCLHQSVILSSSPRIGAFLKSFLGSRSRLTAKGAQPAGGALPAGTQSLPPRLNPNMEATEKTLLKQALAVCRSTREMAVRLGISQAGVSRKLRKHNLHPPGRRPLKRSESLRQSEVID
ncbi:MAG: sigma 54-interacting transcriptional regulator [Deltaproteobacteria bacterium]|jgi:PAS domain S-box-containing protein|nr:sigma 54-interacting transcriptional regulator [Deltaproteobacteria bacterium]